MIDLIIAFVLGVTCGSLIAIYFVSKRTLEIDND